MPVFRIWELTLESVFPCEKRPGSWKSSKTIGPLHYSKTHAAIRSGTELQNDLRWPLRATFWSGGWVPSQRLGWVTGMRAPDPSHQTSGQWQGPWPFGFAEKNSPKMESGKTNEVFIKRKKNTVHVDRNIGGLRERVSHWITPFWWIEFLLWGISSGFPLANLDLPGSQSIFGIYQDPPIWVHTSLSQDGFCQKGSWVEYPLT